MLSSERFVGFILGDEFYHRAEAETAARFVSSSYSSAIRPSKKERNASFTDE